MALKITADGIVMFPDLENYIGKDVDPSIEELTKDWRFKKVGNCMGYSGYRNIRMMALDRQIEIICEPENREEFINKRLDPSKVKWVIVDIFAYWYRPYGNTGEKYNLSFY